MQNFILSNAPSVWVCSFFFNWTLVFQVRKYLRVFSFFFLIMRSTLNVEMLALFLQFDVKCLHYRSINVLFDLKFLSRFLMTPPENVLKQFSDYVGLVRYNDSCTDVLSYTKWSFPWWLKALLQLEKWCFYQLEKWRFYQHLCDLYLQYPV